MAGWRALTFDSEYGEPCIVRQGSDTEGTGPGRETLWLGHEQLAVLLDRQRVQWLVGVLSRWLKSGELAEEESDG
jgi:hypothetical protein